MTVPGRRLFVAISLDGEARRAIARTQDEMARTIGAPDRGSLKWIRPEHVHVTLAFLGHVDEALVADVTTAIAADIPVAPFMARFGGLGVFPPRGAPRVLWMGVRAGAAEIAAVQREVAARVERAGIALEARPFHPHLTLARWRDSPTPDARPVVSAASADAGGGIASVRVEHATLFQSELSPAGSTYRALARATLTACRSSSSLRT